MLVEPGLSPQPSLDALAHRSARRGPPNVLTIDPKIEDYPARVKRLLFGQAEPGGVSRPALADATMDQLVIPAPATLPAPLQRRLSQVAGDGAVTILRTRGLMRVASRVMRLSRGRLDAGECLRAAAD